MVRARGDTLKNKIKQRICCVLREAWAQLQSSQGTDILGCGMESLIKLLSSLSSCYLPILWEILVRSLQTPCGRAVTKEFCSDLETHLILARMTERMKEVSELIYNRPTGDIHRSVQNEELLNLIRFHWWGFCTFLERDSLPGHWITQASGQGNGIALCHRSIKNAEPKRALSIGEEVVNLELGHSKEYEFLIRQFVCPHL